jgi:CheY-like chemotaxis protein
MPDIVAPQQRLWAGVGRMIGRVLRASMWTALPSHQGRPRRPPLPRLTPLPEYPAPPATRLPFPGDLSVLTARFPILHTDDEASLLHLFTLVLARAGLSVVSTAHAAEALRLCQQVPFSLVITDISKPGMSGTDLLARLRADPGTAHLPLIFLTANARFSDDMLWRMGANGCYLKPMSPDDFVAAVRDALITWGNWSVLPPQYNPMWCRELAAQLQQNRVARV